MRFDLVCSWNNRACIMKLETPMARVFPVFRSASMAFYVSVTGTDEILKTPPESNGNQRSPGANASVTSPSGTSRPQSVLLL